VSYFLLETFLEMRADLPDDQWLCLCAAESKCGEGHTPTSKLRKTFALEAHNGAMRQVGPNGLNANKGSGFNANKGSGFNASTPSGFYAGKRSVALDADRVMEGMWARGAMEGMEAGESGEKEELVAQGRIEYDQGRIKYDQGVVIELSMWPPTSECSLELLFGSSSSSSSNNTTTTTTSSNNTSNNTSNGTSNNTSNDTASNTTGSYQYSVIIDMNTRRITLLER
jgi:hypothetical protein